MNRLRVRDPMNINGVVRNLPSEILILKLSQNKSLSDDIDLTFIPQSLMPLRKRSNRRRRSSLSKAVRRTGENDKGGSGCNSERDIHLPEHPELCDRQLITCL
ncbi:hypothetical protein PsorP6_016361 [Peronosclerospora sorghi]|uniref:Uncharacterized protein n=1 Tax=Peronosclerospora sorghi TaxID=230839 RepID=A0ACC0VRD9_9STRA|nr:hypothetical protein PsorP6_016361 [Peronosclerospora sorghi]